MSAYQPGDVVIWGGMTCEVVGPHETHRGLTVIREVTSGDEYAPLTYNLRRPTTEGEHR